MKLRTTVASTAAGLAIVVSSGLIVENNVACGCAPRNPNPQVLPVAATSTTPIVGDVAHVDPGAWVTSGNLAAYPNTSYHYQWYRCDNQGGSCTPAAGTPSSCQESAPGTGCDYTIAAGDAGDTLRAEVAATNAGGSTVQVSLMTPVVGGGPPPPPAGTATAPTNFAATPGNTTVALSWGASTCTNCVISGYHIYRDGTQIATTAQTTYTDTGLTNGNPYTYFVRAYDSTGKEGDSSQSVQAIPQGTPPPPPTGAKVAAAPDCSCAHRPAAGASNTPTRSAPLSTISAGPTTPSGRTGIPAPPATTRHTTAGQGPPRRCRTSTPARSASTRSD